MEDLPLVQKDLVRDHTGKLNTHKSMGPDGMHPRVLAEAIAKPFSVIWYDPVLDGLSLL